MSKNKFWGKPLPNKIEGGLADNKNRSDFDPKSLKEGKQVESEHTKDPEIAEEIASDHLTEDKNYYKKLKTIEKNNETDLQKMSQPTLRFPNIKELPTRPDQEVKSIDRNKVYQIPIKDEAYKEVMGVDHKFVDQQGLENKKLANKLYNKVTEPDLSPSQRHLSRRNWEERLHQSTKNTGTRGGYTFKDSKTSTSLPYVYEDKYANTDFIKEHEAAHHLLNKLSDHPQFGENHRIALVDKLVSMLHPDDYNAIHSNLTINNRYNPNSQKFNEEVLNHIRDFLVSRHTRETHDEFVKDIYPSSYKPIDYNRLKRSWKDITKYAKMLTPAQLKALAEGNGDNMGSNIAAREDLEKNLKSFAVGLGMLGSLSSHAPILNVSNEAPTEEVQPDNSFGTQPEDHFLHNVMQVETSGGKNLNHPLITYGMHKGHKAVGKYALMPLTIKEIAKRHVISGGDDQELHELATSSPDKITKKVKTNPDLELKVARALARHVIERHGDNTPNAAFAWKYGHNLKPKNIDKTKRDSDIYIQKFKKLVAGNETMGLKPYRSVASVEKNENDLNKGSLQSRLKFNPNNISQEDAMGIKEWQKGSGSRFEIPRLEENGRQRALNKLARLTEVRRDPETGKRLFLLHRGMSSVEKGDSLKGNKHIEMDRKSWTPRHAIAHSFSRKYNEGNSIMPVSAWIHEDDIHSYLPQVGEAADKAIFGTQIKFPNSLAGEHEVIVDHTRHALIASDFLVSPKDVNFKINSRFKTKTVDKSKVKGKDLRSEMSQEEIWQQSKHQPRLGNKRRSKNPYVHDNVDTVNEKLAANEGLENDLNKGLNGDWKSEGYRFTKTKLKSPSGLKILKISAFHPDGSNVGNYSFSTNDEHAVYPLLSDTHVDHQRKGLASEAYNMAQKHFKKEVKPAFSQSSDAKKFWAARQSKNENDLNKMSQPSLKFPKLGIENRQEENVQVIDQPRQKELFARKAVQEWVNSPESKKYSKKVVDRSRPKEVKRIAANFDKSNMGVNIGAHAATLGGKEISRYEDGGDVFQQKLKEHFDKKNSIIKEYNQKVIDWRNKASKFTQEHLDTPEGKQAWMEHLKNRPERPKLPKAPAKPKRDASKITDSEKVARGSKIDMIKEHEALHRTMGLIDQKHGAGTRKKISHNLLSQFRLDTVHALWSWVAGRGYKENSPYFTEELLTHARDVLSNPEQRGHFKKFLLRQGKSQEDIDNHIKHLKIGWKKANHYAKHLTKDMLKNEEIDLIKAPVIMDEDTSESIGEGSIASPYQNDSYMTTNQLNNGLYHHVFNNSGYSKHFLSSSPNPKKTEDYLAHISGTHFYNGENAKGLKVNYSKVNKKHKGKGYGKMLYLSALAHHGDMESDENLTSRSNKVWQDLSKLGQGHVQVDLAQTQDFYDKSNPEAELSYHKAKANKEGLRQMLFKQNDKLAASEKIENDLK